MGDRTIEATGSTVIEDIKNNIEAVGSVQYFEEERTVKKSTSGKKDEFFGIYINVNLSRTKQKMIRCFTQRVLLKSLIRNSKIMSKLFVKLKDLGLRIDH